MKKVLLIILLIPFLSNCSQYTAMVGPTITLAENICPTIHSSELTEIFFETLEQMDCEYDPMSIYR